MFARFVPSADYVSITFALLTREAAADSLPIASGQRESATNRLGEHGGLGLGPMRHNAKFSTSRLIVGGISFFGT